MKTYDIKDHLRKPFDKMTKAERDFLGLTARQEVEKLAQKYKGQDAVLDVIGAILAKNAPQKVEENIDE